jgi:hypothetical protein
MKEAPSDWTWRSSSLEMLQAMTKDFFFFMVCPGINHT